VANRVAGAPGANGSNGSPVFGGTTLDASTRPPPTFSAGFVRRPKLVARLAQAREASLALIAAPPGYGKTSLLAEWAEDDGRPFVWVTVDERDDEPARLAASIVRAFVANGLAAAPDDGADAGERLQRMMRASGLPDFVLVLDGAEAVSPPVLREVAGGLLAELPRGSQLAVASRIEPTLSIGALRARRALVELRTSDLAMISADADTLLRRSGLALDEGAVATLVRRTEGWPAGLYLAALSLRDRPEAGESVSDFAGDDHLVVEYLRDEIMDGLSPQTVTFLTHSSVLDELCGPLCDTVLGQEGSGVILGELTRRNLLLVPLDSRHECYRVHTLFRDMLRGDLRRSEPALERTLHLRASSWFAASHDVERAIEHAVAAADPERTGDLLWTNILDLTGAGRNDAVQRWLAHFSPADISDHAPLALAATHSCLIRGDVALAERWARAAASAPRGRAVLTPKSRAAGLAVVESACARNGPARMREDAGRACASEPRDSAWRPICLLLQGVADHLSGDREAAEVQLEAAFHHSAVTAPHVAALCAAQLAIIAIEREDWETAAELADRAVALVDRHRLGAYPTMALVFAACAAARAHERRVDEAKRDLLRCAQLLSMLGDFIPWYEVQTRVLLARAALQLADLVRARTLLAEASRFARRAREVVIFREWFDAAWGHIDAHAEISLIGPSSLTTAELRILRFLPTHLSFREIAKRLHVSANTVKSQAHAVYRKLDASSRSEAVARASEAGLLGP